MVENEILKKLMDPPLLVEKEHFLVKFAENQQEIDAAKRLRYNVFMAEQGHLASSSAANAIDEEVRSIVMNCYEEAKKIILEHEDILHKCTELLLEKERISREEFESLWNEA